MTFVLDKRGGHNRKKVNQHFFKHWSPNMAYILGYIFADGTLIDSKPSRTCYLKITSIDKEHLEAINTVLERDGKLYKQKNRITKNGSKSKDCYYISIGSRKIFNDLLKFGLTPKKSLIIKFPIVPKRYLRDFVRGVFDGDGCIYKDPKSNRLVVTFTSGSKEFLEALASLLCKDAFVTKKRILKGTRCFQIRYSTRETVKVLDFMYRGIEESLFLERKRRIYETWRGTQVVRDLPAKQPYAGSIPARASNPHSGLPPFSILENRN